MPSDHDSVAHWLKQLQAGNRVAVQQLWKRYFRRLVGLARKKLRDTPRRMADEEDVALSAFDSFCRRAERGCFPELTDRDELWRLLVILTSRKAARLLRDQNRKKRGGDRVLVSDLSKDIDDNSLLEHVISREPTPEFAVQVAEEYQRLLRGLDNHELESVALWRLEGYTVEEIATRLGCVPRSVKRKLRLIRGIWEKELAP